MKPKLRPLLLALVTVVALAGFALLLFTTGKPAPLPDPNGYHDFVKAGEMLTGDLTDFVELRDMSEGELRAAFATTAFAKHGEALALARLGLGRESRVPLDYSATSAIKLVELSAIKRVAFAFIAQGRLAEIESCKADAAEIYMDLIRLGHEAARGGIIIDSMSSRNIEAIGLAYLEKLIPKLDAKCCREMASALEIIDERSESPEIVLRQEKIWARRTYGLWGQITRLLTRLAIYQSVKQSEQKMAGRMNAQQSQRRSLVVKLAARSYELEKGVRPKSLADLVPDYLKALPQDTLVGTNIIYSP